MFGSSGAELRQLRLLCTTDKYSRSIIGLFRALPKRRGYWLSSFYETVKHSTTQARADTSTNMNSPTGEHGAFNGQRRTADSAYRRVKGRGGRHQTLIKALPAWNTSLSLSHIVTACCESPESVTIRILQPTYCERGYHTVTHRTHK